jgi:hypothetical protein
MASLIVEADPFEVSGDADGWLVIQYCPIALFSLKSSRATSTGSKTLLTPTPYAVKMAFLDAALRHGLTGDPEGLVRWLAGATLRIGVPQHACVTGTIQSVRQQTLDSERKRKPELPPYRATVALREYVHYHGIIRLAFDLRTCPQAFVTLLLKVAPAINYLGRRGSFIQYLTAHRQAQLGPGFTRPADDAGEGPSGLGQRMALDDFGVKATFAALNSFTSTELRRGVDRCFVETLVPLKVYSSGPAFIHYSAAEETGRT